jgi:hypothetical protein
VCVARPEAEGLVDVEARVHAREDGELAGRLRGQTAERERLGVALVRGPDVVDEAQAMAG